MSPETTLDGAQLLSEQDLYLFNEGSNYKMYEKMGAHLVTLNGEPVVMPVGFNSPFDMSFDST